CKRIERLDVVFVIDGSGSISPEQYQTMKKFMIDLVKKSDVAPDRVQFGAVKYSDEPETFFYLNTYTTKSEIVEAIQNDVTKGGSTYTAKAIGYSEALFAQEHGGRKSKGVPQILIVITDGDSQDAPQLNDTAKRLRDNGIIIYAVGIEGAKPDELLAMAGSKDKYYYVNTFEGLKNTSIAISEKICDDSKPGHRRDHRDLCTPEESLASLQRDCKMLLLLVRKFSLYQLEAYLPDILKALTSLSSLSCNVGTKTQSSVAVYLNNTVTPMFQFHSEKIWNNLSKILIDKPSRLNGNLLESLWKTFPSKADDQNRRKVLLVFSDGLDEDVEELEQKSEELRKKGLDALIAVVLEGASKFDELQYIEFGKGFEYMTQLTIGMRNIAKALSKYVVSHSEKL
ncbi:collagen alpha-6(VI) chain-like, partial [Terrapene carolina triunguis]|uniref:collagen alpha-6(VI) chain-like n=1 Tax=Terrapene triunguis TaxID=2587831 RepID=UPI000E778ADF